MNLPEKLDIDLIEKAMLEQPQAPCPVLHHFGPGIYIRELLLPAGTVAIGHKQKFEHLNIMLTGQVVMINPDKSTKLLTAPMIFTAPPGRKIGYVIDSCVWLNIYATDETDIQMLENYYFDKSDAWQARTMKSLALFRNAHQDDREDFLNLIKEMGLTPNEVRAESEKTHDLCDLPEPFNKYISIRESPIEGQGVYISVPFAAGDYIAPARINGQRTPIGRFCNHAKQPNCDFIKDESGDILLFARQHLHGCEGGGFGEELTVDYRQAVNLTGRYFFQKAGGKS